MTESRSKANLELGCALLFLAPFVVAGLGGLGLGLYLVFTGNPENEPVIAMFGVGTLFTFSGGGLAATVLAGHRSLLALRRRQEEFPDTPWRWRADWAAGTIRCATPGGMILFWIVTVIFGGAGVIILLKFDAMLQSGPIAYALLLFPLVGVGALMAALYRTLRWVKYRASTCELLSNPAVPGRPFRACVRAKLPMAPEDQVIATLTCYHRYVTGAGKNRQIHRDTVWQENVAIARAEMTVQSDGMVSVPIIISLPDSCKPSTPVGTSDRIEWELSVQAEVSGIDFVAEFMVPVFQTDEV